VGPSTNIAATTLNRSPRFVTQTPFC
jgi:hypothetical protein